MSRLSLALLWLLSCAPTPMEPDSGVSEEPAPFDGVSSGNVPAFTNGLIDAGLDAVVDAGPVVLETRCCQLSFFISLAAEPSSATGRIMGDVLPFSAGVMLRQVDGGFAAQACLPVNTSTYYWYEFEWTTADRDAGGTALVDGGYRVRLERHSPLELNYPTGTGTSRNFVPSVSDCASVDAGTGP